MPIEEKLKEYILNHYKSIREFARIADIPYSTMDSVLKRGLNNSSVSNIIKICGVLNISADELANDKIVPITTQIEHKPIKVELNDLIWTTKKDILVFDELTLDGIAMKREEIETFLDVIDMGVEMIRRSRRRTW